MGTVIDFQGWRKRREPDEDRLGHAIGRLEGLLGDRGEDRAPKWLVTEVLAIHGALSLGRDKEAAERAERLVALCEHPSTRTGRQAR